MRRDSWRVIEQRVGSSSSARAQFVWSAAYVDALVQEQRDTDANGSLDRTLYATHDANFNVTAAVTLGGIAQQRFLYDAYGARSVLTFDWQPTAAAPILEHGHQGGRSDAATGFILFRHRYLSPGLMRWTSRDPAGYVDGGSLYEHLRSDPIRNHDALGLQATLSAPPADPNVAAMFRHFGLTTRYPEVKYGDGTTAEAPATSQKAAVAAAIERAIAAWRGVRLREFTDGPSARRGCVSDVLLARPRELRRDEGWLGSGVYERSTNPLLVLSSNTIPVPQSQNVFGQWSYWPVYDLHVSVETVVRAHIIIDVDTYIYALEGVFQRQRVAHFEDEYRDTIWFVAQSKTRHVDTFTWIRQPGMATEPRDDFEGLLNPSPIRPVAQPLARPPIMRPVR